MNRWMGLWLTGALLAGCQLAPAAHAPQAAPQAAPGPTAGRATAVVTLAAPTAPARGLLATAHRWEAFDVYQYDAQLYVWNGAAFIAVAPTVVVTVPRKVGPKTQAVFSNLKQGYLYRVGIRAMGNAGGTAAGQQLNTVTPTTVDFDFRYSQDIVQDLAPAPVSVTLDPRAFSGNALIQPQYLPPFTTQVEIVLKRDGTTVLTQTVQPTQSLAVSNLRVGPDYQVFVTAKDGAGAVLASATSGMLTFDPNGQNVEQDVTFPVPFATAPPITGGVQ